MHTLLIVDDEKWVRQGLSLTIDWTMEGIKLIGEAEDGEEALKLVEERMPDIIITDIKMPGMDGISLIEALISRQWKSKIIIISGYSDFHYAQKALKCGAFDYILKPIEETNILDVVRRCVVKLENERAHQHQTEKMSSCIRESLPLARQRFLESLLLGEVTQSENVQKNWHIMNIRLDPQRMNVLAVTIYDWGVWREERKDRQLITYALGNMAEELGSKWGSVVACPSLHNHIAADLVLLQTGSAEFSVDNQLTQKTMSIIQAAKQYLSIRINIGMSKERTWALLPHSLEEAIHSGAFAFYEGYGHVYDARRLLKYSKPFQEYSGLSVWESRLIHAMKVGNKQILMESIGEIVEHLLALREQYTPFQLQLALKQLLQNVDKKIKASCKVQSSHNGSSLSMDLQVPFCTLSEMKQKLWETLMQYHQAICALGSRKRMIDLALKYIDEHFMNGIMMNDVAEGLYFNPSYFSRVFHEEMGETFSKYLQRIRVEEAKRLLRQSSYKIYEIAMHVGYNDFRHFTKMFKEVEGITPAQYRDLGIQ